MDNVTFTTLLCLREIKKILGKDIVNHIYHHLNSLKAIQRFSDYLRVNNVDPQEFNKMLINNNAIVAGSSILKFYMNGSFNINDVDIFVKYSKEYPNNGPVEQWIENNNKDIYCYDVNSYTMVYGILYSKHYVLRDSEFKFNIIVLSMNPQEFIENNFDIDCCKLMYNGIHVYGPYNIYHNIHKRITYAKQSPICSIDNCYRLSKRFSQSVKGISDVNGCLTKRLPYTYFQKFCVVYQRYRITFEWDYINFPGVDINTLHKLENIMDLNKTTSDFDTITTDHLKLIYILTYLERLEIYKRRGFIIIDKSLN